jgi:hypothetical protein
MWLAYVLAVVVGGGLLFMQAISGGHHAVEGGAAPDVQHHGAGPGVLSLRSAIYGLFTFGFVGGALHIPRLASPGAALGLAALSGLCATVAAGLTFSRLGSAEASGAASLLQAKGRRARVLLACTPDRAGKIRLDLGGQQVDMQATSAGGIIPAGAEVVVVEVREDVARVAPTLGTGGAA